MSSGLPALETSIVVLYTDCMEVHLTPQQQSFLERSVRTGRFASQEEAVREAVELLEKQERAREEMRAAVDEGDDDIAHGRYQEYTDEAASRLAEELKREARALSSPGILR